MILLVIKLAYFIHNLLLAHTRNASTKVIRVISHKPPLSGSQYVRLLVWLYVLPLQSLLVPDTNETLNKLEQANFLTVLSVTRTPQYNTLVV